MIRARGHSENGKVPCFSVYAKKTTVLAKCIAGETAAIYTKNSRVPETKICVLHKSMG